MAFTLAFVDMWFKTQLQYQIQCNGLEGIAQVQHGLALKG